MDVCRIPQISIHAPRTGSDRGSALRLRTQRGFQSTLPARGATNACAVFVATSNYFNPRSPHGERRVKFRLNLPHVDFNPRSPHGERHAQFLHLRFLFAFQSTLPARGATLLLFIRPMRIGEFQSTLPARGATNSALQLRGNLRIFQSTLPARGATSDVKTYTSFASRFQSTLPARGATIVAVGCTSRRRHFNPRSPHGERRSLASGDFACHQYFNPRSPHGERLQSATPSRISAVFQSTLPARGATCFGCHCFLWRVLHFNPRSPHGERRVRCRFVAIYAHFNPRSPHGERRDDGCNGCPVNGDFNPRSPHGERRRCRQLLATKTVFQSTLPARGATRSLPRFPPR